jgi:hypothetical protein
MSTEDFFNEETSNGLGGLVWNSKGLYPFGKVVCENYYILVP